MNWISRLLGRGRRPSAQKKVDQVVSSKDFEEMIRILAEGPEIHAVTLALKLCLRHVRCDPPPNQGIFLPKWTLPQDRRHDGDFQDRVTALMQRLEPAPLRCELLCNRCRRETLSLEPRDLAMMDGGGAGTQYAIWEAPASGDDLALLAFRRAEGRKVGKEVLSSLPESFPEAVAELRRQPAGVGLGRELLRDLREQAKAAWDEDPSRVGAQGVYIWARDAGSEGVHVMDHRDLALLRAVNRLEEAQYGPTEAFLDAWLTLDELRSSERDVRAANVVHARLTQSLSGSSSS